jgi:23S rRNA pseudouridine2605 synthase
VTAGVRIQKALADAGVASRRAAEELVVQGRVAVDGQPAAVGQRVDPARSQITVDGRPVGAPAERVYLVMAKPAGVTSTVADRHARRTVLDLIPPDLRRRAARLYPVGRLDRDSEGLLLLTNDGQWAQRMLHPSHAVEREYAVGLGQPLEPEQVRDLGAGVELGEGLAKLDGLRPASTAETRLLGDLLGPDTDRLAWYRAVLHQGWKRQLRRMFDAVGARVERLVRVRFGTLRLGAMALGEVRPLTAAERRHLDALVRGEEGRQ